MKILRSIIKEQVENKINPILKEKYQENIALKLFRASIEISMCLGTVQGTS